MVKKIRILLVFFCACLLVSCQRNSSNPNYRIDYSEGQKAYQIAFEGDENPKEYSVRLKGSKNSIFGDYFEENGSRVFRPLIPFSWDQEYEIYHKGQLYLEFSVRTPENIIRPKLLGIYPKLDTVPENLLKMYFEFDQPMKRTQSSLDFIKVFNLTNGGEVDIFLSLENELWNREKTRLTLWLDPGRIKKDLIPNQEKGIPIQEGNEYELIVERHFSGGEYDADLGKRYVKRFYVAKRDEKKPDVHSWQITVPEKNTKSGLGIDFGEFLDSFLVGETIKIYKLDTEIEGSFFVSKKANSVVFIPAQAWEKGDYQIRIESRLEDLAGNNLNRLFDEDLTKNDKILTSEYKTLAFTIQ